MRPYFKMFKRKINKHIAETPEIEATTIARSGRVVLKTPVGQVALLTTAGQLTEAGKYYYEKTGKDRPHSGFDPSQPLARDGHREYIVMRNNKKRLARRWDAGESDFVYTNLGKQYFGLRKEVEEYVAMLPIRIQGKTKRRARLTNALGTSRTKLSTCDP